MRSYCLLIFAIVTLLSCSHIDESDRLIEVPYAKISKAVLIEDFTGQRCVNCPNAVLEIERLQQEYGKDNIVPVAIHSGPLAVYSNAKITGLRTQTGDDYYDYWNVEVEPSGLINRKGSVALLSEWTSMVHQELQQETTIILSTQYQINETDEINIDVTALAIQSFQGKLQLWVTEDSITAPQMMPDGTMNTNYIHNHVFRTAINDSWGTDVNWQSGQTYTLTFKTKVENEWNREQLTIVAFVYNEDGVQQVTTSNNKIIN